MRIEKFSFGSVVIKGRKYNRDVFVTNEFVEERERSHKITLDDIDRALLHEPEIVIIGRGTSGMVEIPDEVRARLAENNVELIEGKTPEVIKEFNKLVGKRKLVGIFHLTC